MSLGPLELAMIAAIALLFFGPAKLPQLGKSIGEAIRGFKGAMNDMNEEISRPEQKKDPSPGATAPTEAANSEVTSKTKEKDPAR